MKTNSMTLGDINAETKNLLMEKGFFEFWVKHTNEGFAICRRKGLAILFINKQCLDILAIEGEILPRRLDEILTEAEIQVVVKEENGFFLSPKGTHDISSFHVGDYIIIIINDLTKVTAVEKKANEIKQLNKELQMIYSQYADDTIFITDGKGIVEFSGATIAANCGVSPDYMIGKSVYDLEKAKYFSPSVTAIVRESKQTEVIIQHTKTGKTLVSVGTPIFNESGEISKVISITRDYSRQIKIGTMLSKEMGEVQGDHSLRDAHKHIITCNDKMLNILALTKLVSMVNSNVLINGETGTGKEVIARQIYSSGPRSSKPFIKVNCGSISPNLVESELFGYEPGSFTGASKEGKVGLVEAANGGTLFLDEISELPLNQQVKLLQVIQERSMTRVGGIKDIKLDIRVIAATNKNLELQVEKGEFREDLYYRLNVVPINLPPLRERGEDIPLLIRHFLNFYNAEYNSGKEFTKEAFSLMCKYQWPGNVRELANTVERLVITTLDALIDIENLPERIKSVYGNTDELVRITKIMNLSDAVEELECKLIKMALEKYGSGRVAAESLGINQSTISRKMSQYGISSKKV